MTERYVASSDATNIKLSIKREKGEVIVNGLKWWISGAGDPRCAVHLVMGQRFVQSAILLGIVATLTRTFILVILPIPTYTRGSLSSLFLQMRQV
jgi:alkylation response protein AidB-like acyl-CoA dehydrogenase